MERNLKTALNMYEKYVGNGLHLFLLAGALIVLLFFRKSNKAKIVFWLYTVLFTVIYACPLTAGVIIKFFIGRSVYWRMFWALPSVLITAFAFVCVLEQLSRKWLRAVVFAVLAITIGVTGSFVLTGHNFTQASNIYKLPWEVPYVCEAISKDAKEQNVEKIKVVVPNDLLCYIRQYDAGFYMPYGRNALRSSKLADNIKDLLGEMNAENPDYAYLDNLLNEEGCSYLVWKGNADYDIPFGELGYQFIESVSEYRVYRIVD